MPWLVPAVVGVTAATSSGQKVLGLGVAARAQLPWEWATATRSPAPGAPQPEGPLPLCGSAGFGTQQVLEETLELRVPEGFQAAGGPEGGVPERSLGCSWQ